MLAYIPYMDPMGEGYTSIYGQYIEKTTIGLPPWLGDFVPGIFIISQLFVGYKSHIYIYVFVWK